MGMTTRNNKKLPDFLCVGVEKCGTTTLYDLLKQHPGIGLSIDKETHFFNSNWDKGIKWYQEKFSHSSDSCQVIGEITPAYHRFKEVIPRIKQSLKKDLKIILMLREPRQRAFSHYIHDFSYHQEITDLVYKRYLTTTAYAPILKDYFSSFGKASCLVLVFEEDVLLNQQQLVTQICSFLNVSSISITPVHSNRSRLPILCPAPDQPSQIFFDHHAVHVPANSWVIYTGQQHTTRILPANKPLQLEQVRQKIQSAVSFIPALKSSIIFEQNVAKDLEQVEQCLNRSLSCWRKPLGDLTTHLAPQPEFISV